MYRSLVLLATFLTANGTCATTADIASRFFPAELKVRDGVPVRAKELQHVAVTEDLDHSGQSLVVALYTNDDQGALAVLSAKGEGALVALDEDGLPGGTPALELLDLDGDGRKEILATVLHGRAGSTTWVYKWQGTTLRRLHRAQSMDVLDDAIVDPTFLDLDGNGVFEIIEHTVARETNALGEQHPVAVYDVLSVANGEFHRANTATILATFLRGKGTPRPVTRSFTVEEAVAQRLVVLNGTPADAARVASAIIKINGDTVLSERDFNESVARRDIPVTVVKGENTLTVEVRGAPAGQVTILLLPQ
jgi:hypothetical protein